MENMNTIGTIADRLGVAIHKVKYVIEAEKIVAQSKAGNALIYSNEQFRQIQAVLAVIQSRRGKVKSGK